MQVLCKSTIGRGEIQCCVCGKGFVMFWERQTQSERAAAIREIQNALRKQHGRQPGQQAHPSAGFQVPEWDNHIAFTGAAIPGNAPTWAL